MKKITLQDIFDKAWKKFVVECGKPASDDGTTCQYKVTVDGEVRNCAVGLALSEEQISEIIGNPNFAELYTLRPEWFDIDMNSSYYDQLVDEFKDENLELFNYSIINFQKRLHDGLIAYLGKPECISLVRENYLAVAKDYNLKVPE